MEIVDEICFWFMVQPQLLYGAQVLKSISNAAISEVELKAKKAYDFLLSKCAIPVEQRNQRAIFEEFNFPF